MYKIPPGGGGGSIASSRPKMYTVHTSVRFHIACKKTLFWSQNCLTQGNNSVIMNLFSIEIVYLFPEVLSVSLSEYSVIKREFKWKQICSQQFYVRYWIFCYNEWRYKEIWLYQHFSSDKCFNISTRYCCSYHTYCKTCLKWPLKNRQNKDLNDKW